METGTKVETVRTLKIWGWDDKQIDSVEKGSTGRVSGYVFEGDVKRDVIFDDHRNFSIPVRWLKPVDMSKTTLREVLGR
jgi:hypothetical protein